MPIKEDVLREETFKDAVDVERRVYYTLSAEKEFQSHRNSKAIAILIGRMVDGGTLTSMQLDDLLLKLLG
jgi:hypothetical protein